MEYLYPTFTINLSHACSYEQYSVHSAHLGVYTCAQHESTRNVVLLLLSGITRGQKGLEKKHYLVARTIRHQQKKWCPRPQKCDLKERTLHQNPMSNRWLDHLAIFFASTTWAESFEYIPVHQVEI